MNLIFEMHLLVHLEPKLVGAILSIDYVLNILLIAYVRHANLVEEKNDNDSALSGFKIDFLINTYLINEEISYIFNGLLILIAITLITLVLTTDPDNPRRRGSAWFLKLIIVSLFMANTCLSYFILLP